MSLMIRLVCFDLWKTLIYEEGSGSLRKILEVLNLEIPYATFRKIFQQTVETHSWKSKEQAYSRLCEALGVEIADSNIDKIKRIRDNVKDAAHMYPHSLSMLKQLKKHGLKVGIISNSDNFTIHHIQNTLELFKHVDYMVFSFEVGAAKPDLHIFREMLKISNFKPEEAVMIGDMLEDDILPARQIGMAAIHFQNYEQLKKDFKAFSIYLQ